MGKTFLNCRNKLETKFIGSYTLVCGVSALLHIFIGSRWVYAWATCSLSVVLAVLRRLPMLFSGTTQPLWPVIELDKFSKNSCPNYTVDHLTEREYTELWQDRLGKVQSMFSLHVEDVWSIICCGCIAVQWSARGDCCCAFQSRFFWYHRISHEVHWTHNNINNCCSYWNQLLKHDHFVSTR